MVIDVRKIREDKGLSIRQIEYKTGLSRSHISDIEVGNVLPRIDDICKLAHGFQMAPAALFTTMIDGEEWQ